jgi:hypothetical protein
MTMREQLDLDLASYGCLTNMRRLRLIELACDYGRGWAAHVYGRYYRDVVDEMQGWRWRKYGVRDEDDDNGDDDDERGDLLDELNDERNDD